MKRETSLGDYLRLSRATPTVEREFEAFKEQIFNTILIWDDGKLHTPAPNTTGLYYDSKKKMFNAFDRFKNLSYEEAAAIAYTKYYRAINAFILPFESRALYLDMAITYGPMQAIKVMQDCVGVDDDGIIGPVTREKMQFVTPDCLAQGKRPSKNFLKKFFS
jgi:hypothetical protein